MGVGGIALTPLITARRPELHPFLASVGVKLQGPDNFDTVADRLEHRPPYLEWEAQKVKRWAV